ncbi:MAG TPA: hypothetical protein VGT98_07705 [Candidatus Elarobacter sp.]|nr:hypothetical protein [Candidatus Elarobacter sp.]
MAAVAVVVLAACGANTHGTSVQPARTVQHEARLPAVVAHGAEIESAQNLIVSEGNNHMAFPPGATVKRTVNGYEVTYNGTTRTFSSSARVDTGTYHRYAKGQ